mgnify:FL=1|tara:strand:- start:1134 stop:1691 length:558 start_codon:yes stop_codon:yes gene_type:complete
MQQRESSDKKNLRKAYEEANSILPKTLPYITNKEAEKAYSLLVRKFGKRKDAAPRTFYNMNYKTNIKKVWVCLSGNASTLHKGWRRLIHDVAHRIFRYRSPSLPDHCKLQAEFEAKLVRYVNTSGWLNGALKPKVKVLSRNDKFNIKVESTQNLIKSWKTKQARANNKLKKLQSKLKRLQKSLAN